jgi:GNAT superfamily N-acetyltransferase
MVATLFAIVETILRPVLRLRRRLVYIAFLDDSRTASKWAPSERLVVVGLEDLAGLNAQTKEFLSSADQQEDLRGIQDGNRLFLVMEGEECLHRGYVRLIDAGSNDRKTVFFGLEELPEIRSCATAPQARGKGLYRRVLNEQLRYLRKLGHDRALLYVMGENIASIKGATAAGFRLHRKLNDWILLNLFVLQQVREGDSTRWRTFLR